MASNLVDKTSKEMIELVRSIETEEDSLRATEIISKKIGVDYQQASMIVESLRVVIQNDYLLLDMFLEVMNKVLATLELRKCINQDDIKKIMKEMDDYNDKEEE